MMVGSALLNPDTMELDVNGLYDPEHRIQYLGIAKRDEFGRWVCCAIIDGVGLCRIEIRLEPDWDKLP